MDLDISMDAARMSSGFSALARISSTRWVVKENRLWDDRRFGATGESEASRFFLERGGFAVFALGVHAFRVCDLHQASHIGLVLIE